MGPSIGIKIENRHLAELISLRRRCEGLLKLTTIRPDQKKASVKVYYLKGRKKDFLTEFNLTDLHRGGSRVPAIDLKADYNGWFRLTLTLVLNGKVREKRDFTLAGRLLPDKIARRGVPFILVPLFAVLLVLFFYPGLHRTTPQAPVVERERDTGPSAAEERSLPDQVQPPAETGGGVTTRPAADTVPGASGSPPEDSRPSSPAAVTGQPEPAAEERVSETGQDEPPAPAVRHAFDAVTVYFEPDSSRLTSEGKRRLGDILDELSSFDGGVVITGHCASYGTESGRMDLSRRRAEEVYDFLTSSGWNPPTAPRVEGYGSKKPAVQEADMQHLNRRVEIAPVDIYNH